MKIFQPQIVQFISCLFISLSACNATSLLSARATTAGQNSATPSSTEGSSIPNSHSPDQSSAPSVPPVSVPDAPPSVKVPLVGNTCHSIDSEHICLALKYVAYNDSKGVPVVSQNETISNVSAINQVWQECNIGFQIEEFLPLASSSYGLSFNTSKYSELDKIRQTFDDGTTLLVVTTGKWDRTGTLGNTYANAWTNLPGGDIFGAVLEEPVGTYTNIIAHELGHYLNLDHVNDTSDLMNPIVYISSNHLTASQCQASRSAAGYYWKMMQR